MRFTDSHAAPHFAPAAQPHPAFRGTSSYQIADNRIQFLIDEIANPRAEGDISGTLSVELWALTQPYNGGGFDGVVVAGTQVGEIFGQHFIANSQHSLDFQEPPVGSWQLTLMLREWTGSEFVTRDSINFPTRYVTQPVASTPETITIDEPVVIEASASDVAEPKAEPTAKRNARQSPATKPANAPVSVNRATLDELAATKGMPSKLAEGIVAARPFSSLDALLKVKGMGPKLLEKLRSMLSL